MAENAPSDFLSRNEFLIRRLHSLSGLIPVGAYTVVHLCTNASVLDGGLTFQKNVHMIHSLGAILPVVEWGFIFIPILFHAILGVVIVKGGLPNTGTYRYGSNIRYTLQRATGMIAFVFILWHVLHMHGWFHFEPWLENVAHPLGGAKFHPYNAASSAAAAMQASGIIPVLYAIGVVSIVFHLANGIWGMGITWGVWTSEQAQRRALCACTVFGLGLGLVGLGAIGGLLRLNPQAEWQTENEYYEKKSAIGDVIPNEHKRWTEGPAGEQRPAAAAQGASTPAGDT